jgi:hypothetical protein
MRHPAPSLQVKRESDMKDKVAYVWSRLWRLVLCGWAAGAFVALVGWLGLMPPWVNPSGLVGAMTIGFYYEYASHRMKQVKQATDLRDPG